MGTGVSGLTVFFEMCLSSYKHQDLLYSYCSTAFFSIHFSFSFDLNSFLSSSFIAASILCLSFLFHSALLMGCFFWVLSILNCSTEYYLQMLSFILPLYRIEQGTVSRIYLASSTSILLPLSLILN